jgi:hypothetical protein
MTLVPPPPPPPAPAAAPSPTDFNKAADYWRYVIEVNVFPAKSKKKVTFITWKQSGYQDNPISEEQHNEWKRTNAFADGMAVMTGPVWRGEHADEYFNCIDCDNKLAITEFCTRDGQTVPLEMIAEKFIVEQHKDNPNKAHIYFYSKIPLVPKSTSTSTVGKEKIENNEVPGFEIKSQSNTIVFCTPSFHQNGRQYEFIGNCTIPLTLNERQSTELMQHLDNIHKKYEMQYLEVANGNGKSLIPMSELEKKDFVILEGNNRHEGLLRYMDSRIKIFGGKVPEQEIKELCHIWNKQHCKSPLDEKEFEKQWKSASTFIERKKREREREEEQKQQQEQEQKEQEKEEQPKIELTEDLTREVSFDEIADIQSISIKKDKPAKVISFCGMLLTQTNNDQLNIGYQAESSAGKSYIPLEIADYFPVQEVKEIAAASPTSFFHDSGEWDNERKALIVDLRHKILIFIDMPSYELLQRLRPMLSHDKPELRYMITDKSQKHGLRTKNVIIKGPPSVFFCTTKLDPDEQERTRMLLLSPETGQDKLRESLELAALKRGNHEAYRKQITEDPKRLWLSNRIYWIRRWGIREVILSDDSIKRVLERFKREHPYLQPRHQRDFPRIFSLIKAHAILNCFNREKVDGDDTTIMATEADIEAGFKLYKEIERPNELGLSPYIHDIYQDVIQPLLRKLTRDSEGEAITGVAKEVIIKRHYEIRHKPLSPEMLKSVLLQLESVGLVKQEPDPNDRRKTLVYPTPSSDIY